jgi:hypothetical protein
MTSEEKQNEKQSKDLKENPRITEATQKDWDDFFSVQEDNLFDRNRVFRIKEMEYNHGSP